MHKATEIATDIKNRREGVVSLMFVVYMVKKRGIIYGVSEFDFTR